jgi:2-polyprenyl-3-methyl-5-hydroxy-6-metoxy-1,4-benzoquinol methylase
VLGEEFRAERGYFWRDDQADRTGGGERGERWKNVDFLRLKDEPLFAIDPRPGLRILEVGCGGGPNLVYLGLQGATVYGQDLDAEAVEHTNAKLAHFGIAGRAEVGDASKLLFDDASMDAVLTSDFHEHLTETEQLEVLSEVWRVLVPGGTLALKTPNVAYLQASLRFKQARALLRCKSPRGYVIPETTGPEPEHIGLSHRWRLSRQLERARFWHYQFVYPPLRRFGIHPLITVLSSEVPVVRDVLCEDLIVVARKPIAYAHFPD